MSEENNIQKDLMIPFLGHSLYVKHIDWSNGIVILECNDACIKSQKVRIRCSIRDLRNLQANLWVEIIKGEKGKGNNERPTRYSA